MKGKGYPDVATRVALRRLSDAAAALGSSLPIYGLFDYDPDGLAIFSTYKNGSKALAFDKSNLVVPTMRWIGPLGHHFLGMDDERNSQGLLRMSVRDRKKAVQMLQWSTSCEEALRSWWRQVLHLLLFMNMKFEIELLDWTPGGLLTWLSGSLAAEGST